MLKIPLAGLFLGALLCMPGIALAAPEQSRIVGGTEVEQRIVGGTAADVGEYPFMAGVLSRSITDPYFAQFCGATLLAADWVLTAAHCVEDVLAGEIDIFIGHPDLRSGMGERIPVIRIEVHPQLGNGVPDLALLQLQRAAGQTPIPALPAGTGLESAGTSVTVLGWGSLTENGGGTSRLQEVDLAVSSDSQCTSVYGPNVDVRYEICAWVPQGGKDACFGDSGGPMLVNQSGQWRLLGVVSGGAGCARPGVPGIYARVPAAQSWLQSFLGGESSPGPVLAFSSSCSGLSCRFTAPAADAGGSQLSAQRWLVDGVAVGGGAVLDQDFPAAGSYLVSLQANNAQGQSFSVASYVNLNDDSIIGLGGFSAGSINRPLAASQELDADPMLVLGLPGFVGAHPGGWRLSAAGGGGFQVRFQEWDYLLRDFGDNGHTIESAGFLSAMPGRYVMSDGSIWQFGRFSLSGTNAWQQVTFPVSFQAGDPVRVFATVQSENEVQMVSLRLRHVDHSGFEAALFEEEALMNGHAQEQVAYVALVQPAGSGSLRLQGRLVPYALSRLDIGSIWTQVGSHEVFLEEEQSRDAETGHVPETVDLLSIDGHLFGQPASFNGADTFLLRRR